MILQAAEALKLGRSPGGIIGTPGANASISLEMHLYDESQPQHAGEPLLYGIQIDEATRSIDRQVLTFRNELLTRILLEIRGLRYGSARER